MVTCSASVSMGASGMTGVSGSNGSAKAQSPPVRASIAANSAADNLRNIFKPPLSIGDCLYHITNGAKKQLPAHFACKCALRRQFCGLSIVWDLRAGGELCYYSKRKHIATRKGA